MEKRLELVPDKNVEWRAVVGYEGLYEVSSEGNVRSCDRDMLLESGKRYCRKGKVLGFNLKKGSFPYRRVKVSRGGKTKLLMVSRIVLQAFDREPHEGEQACHCNGNVSDNRLSNLRWDCPKGNHSDRVLHGTAPIGEKNPRARLTEADVRAVRTCATPLKELAAKLGVSCRYLSNIRSRITWKHVY